jgi:hypothetical protein
MWFISMKLKGKWFDDEMVNEKKWNEKKDVKKWGGFKK